MSLPSGIVLAWPNSAPIPAGWTRVPELDGRFPKQLPTSATVPGTQGGVSVHTHADGGHAHTGQPHSHDGANSITGYNGIYSESSIFAETPSCTFAAGSAAPPHVHQVIVDAQGVAFGSLVAGWGSAPVLPPYLDVIWIVSGGRWKIPSAVIAFFADSSVPSGMGELSAARARFLRGAAPGKTGGASGGGGPHAHAPLGPHAHRDDGAHGHTQLSVGLQVPNGGDITQTQAYSGGAHAAPLANHLHDLGTISNGVAATQAGFVITPAADPRLTAAAATGPAAGAVTITPLNTQLLHVQVTQLAPMFVPVGTIALFRFGLDTLGAGWRFCDGTHGTPDLTAYYFAQGAAPGSLLAQGGSAGHSHAAPAGHAHPSATTHTHQYVTLGADISPATTVNPDGMPFGAGGPNATISPHNHDWHDAPGITPLDPGGATDSQVQPISAAGTLLPSYTELAFVMFTGHAFSVGISDPTPDEVEITPTPTVAWTLPGGRTQAHYQVSILDAAQAAIVWTSGWTAGVTASIAVPTGVLANLTDYYAVVDVDDSLGDYGESDLVPFSVAFTPSTVPTGLAVVQFGGDTTPPALPGAQLSWGVFVPTGGEVWQHWNVYRRVHGTTAWTLLTTLTDSGARGYTDYTVSGSLSYDYKLSYTITRWTVYSVESAADGPVTAAISFTGVWLHVVSDPGRALRYDAGGGTTTPVQDQKVVAVWGRRQPTVHVGLQHWQQWTFTGVYRAFPDLATWRALFDLGEAAAEGNVLSIRFGNTGEAFFGIIDLASSTGQRADAPFGWESVLAVNEVFFDGGSA